MRRSERAITDMDDIAGVVEKCPIIRLGLSDDGLPYIVPLNFGYSYNCGKLTIYFHGAKEGRKIDILKKEPNVCFEMDHSFELKTGAEACQWSAYYESVIGYGNASFVEDDNEKTAAMNIIMKRYGFEGVPHYTPAALSRVLICKIEVDTITGKRNLPA